ncbi:hypothetical protein O6H91_08G093500 [Diphasiastrum complanatum]|uniref:Uncharacterized protein n=1 Tax=Diphasiastrum complanatum TaxID=34168 RepID=A0ACC2CZX9_DIPCM|nr:hypothetical protein O6H91_08G093500 [Diphasiastrum complanatum]
MKWNKGKRKAKADEEAGKGMCLQGSASVAFASRKSTRILRDSLEGDLDSNARKLRSKPSDEDDSRGRPLHEAGTQPTASVVLHSRKFIKIIGNSSDGNLSPKPRKPRPSPLVDDNPKGRSLHDTRIQPTTSVAFPPRKSVRIQQKTSDGNVEPNTKKPELSPSNGDKDNAKKRPDPGTTDWPSVKQSAEVKQERKQTRRSSYGLRPRVLSADCLAAEADADADQSSLKLKSSKRRGALSRKSETVPCKRPKQSSSQTPMERPPADGYNWKKYGQKHIKVFGKIRSYYKCSIPSCSMKKNVEQSVNERINETTYIGEHNHPKPKVLRKWTCLAKKFPSGPRDNDTFLDSRATDAETLKSEVVFAFKRDLSTQLQGQDCIDGNPKLPSPSTFAKEEGNQFLAVNCEADQPISREQETSNADSLLRVAFETRGSKMHKDGYSWWKYGEKMIRGSRHPRSYYKCPFAGCPMRKRVTRTAGYNSITTYHGEHKHEFPALKSLHLSSWV